jgi:hypothetical protein
VIIYAKKKSYVIFGIIACPLILGGVMSLFQNGDPSFLLVFTGLLAFSYLWLSRFKLELNESELIYRNLLRGSRSVLRSSITKIKWVSGTTSGLDGMFRVEIWQSNKSIAVVINASVFQHAELKRLVDSIDV